MPSSTYLIAPSNGLAVLPKPKCKHCSNPATHEYDGIKLCFSHWVAEERANE